MIQPNSKSYRIQGEGKEARSNVFLTRNKMLHLYPLNLLEKKIKKPLYDVPGHYHLPFSSPVALSP